MDRDAKLVEQKFRGTSIQSLSSIRKLSASESRVGGVALWQVLSGGGGGSRDRAFAGGWRDSDGGATDRHYSTIHSVAQSYVTKAFHLQAHCGNPGDINCRGSLPLSATETDLSTPLSPPLSFRGESPPSDAAAAEGRGPRSAISLRITYSAAMRRLCPPAFPTDPPPFRKGFLRLTNTSSEGDASVERDCLLSALLPRPRRILIFRGEPRRGGKKRWEKEEERSSLFLSSAVWIRPSSGLKERVSCKLFEHGGRIL